MYVRRGKRELLAYFWEVPHLEKSSGNSFGINLTADQTDKTSVRKSFFYLFVTLIVKANVRL